MKRLICLMMALAMLFAAGCGKKDAKTDTKPVTQEQQEEAPPVKIEELSENEFIQMVNSDTRPVAVMIDNDGESSRPQIALESAYLLYEVTIEAGASRIMALFKDTSVGKIGPIRSSRHYFLDYAMENDAIYTHAGWSPRAEADIPALGVNNINGILGNDGTIFYRDNTYDNTWHNLYTRVSDVYNFAGNNKKYRTTSDIRYTWYSEEEFETEDGAPATEVSIPYSNYYKLNYKYNPETKLYDRFIGSKAHVSQTGNGLTAKNIIICHVNNYDLNDGQNKGRQEVETVGSGKGYVITNGKANEITWSKASREARTEYKYLNGEDIVLNAGNTYVQIVPVSSAVSFK